MIASARRRLAVSPAKRIGVAAAAVSLLLAPALGAAAPASAASSTGTITGTVTENGAPDTNAYVAVYETGFEGTSCYTNCAWVWDVPTDSQGAYSLGGLPAGDYRVRAMDQGPASQWYSSPDNRYDTAGVISLGAGQTVSGADIDVKAAATLNGSMAVAAGAPSGEVHVRTFQKSGKLWVPGDDASGGSASTTAQPWSLPVAAGTYRVGFQQTLSALSIFNPQTPQTLAPQFFDSKPNGPSAQDVTVAAGASASDLNATLSPVSTANITSDRISGGDRYATSVAIADKGYPTTAPVVFIATGNNFPDALAAGPAAAKLGGPLLLTSPGVLPSNVASKVTSLKPAKIYVVGGAVAIGDSVLAQLQSAAPSATVTRIAGADRYDTARKVVSVAFGSKKVPGAYFATGANYPDALSAAAAAGAQNEPVILINGSASALDQATSDLVTSLGLSYANIAGGTNAVSAGVETSLQSLISSTTATNGSVVVQRFAGGDRTQTSAMIAADAFPTDDTAFLATGFQFPDALAGSALAGELGHPLLTVRPGCVPADTITAIEHAGITKVSLIGGTAALNSGVASLTGC